MATTPDWLWDWTAEMAEHFRIAMKDGELSDEVMEKFMEMSEFFDKEMKEKGHVELEPWPEWINDFKNADEFVAYLKRRFEAH